MASRPSSDQELSLQLPSSIVDVLPVDKKSPAFGVRAGQLSGVSRKFSFSSGQWDANWQRVYGGAPM
jgi:hypothetical protein